MKQWEEGEADRTRASFDQALALAKELGYL